MRSGKQVGYSKDTPGAVIYSVICLTEHTKYWWMLHSVRYCNSVARPNESGTYHRTQGINESPGNITIH